MVQGRNISAHIYVSGYMTVKGGLSHPWIDPIRTTAPILPSVEGGELVGAETQSFYSRLKCNRQVTKFTIPGEPGEGWLACDPTFMDLTEGYSRPSVAGSGQRGCRPRRSGMQGCNGDGHSSRIIAVLFRKLLLRKKS